MMGGLGGVWPEARAVGKAFPRTRILQHDVVGRMMGAEGRRVGAGVWFVVGFGCIAVGSWGARELAVELGGMTGGGLVRGVFQCGR